MLSTLSNCASIVGMFLRLSTQEKDEGTCLQHKYTQQSLQERVGLASDD